MSKKMIKKKEGRVIEKVAQKRNTTPEDSFLSEESSDDEEADKTFLSKGSSDDVEDDITFLSEGSSDDEEDETSESLNLSEESSDDEAPEYLNLTIQTEDDGCSGDRHGLEDYRNMKLQPNHVSKPFWVDPSGHIFLETFSPLYQQAQYFLMAISEPVCRPKLIHEYKLTKHSLFAAASVGFQSKNIIKDLKRLSKVDIPKKLVDFIISSTQRYGKAKLVLKSGRYFVESTDPDVVKTLKKDPVFKEYRIDRIAETLPAVTELPSTAGPISNSGSTEGGLIGCCAIDFYEKLADEENEALKLKTTSFEVKQEKIEQVQKRCIELKYPLVSEYEFRLDTTSKIIDIDLKPSTKLHPYQEDSLRKVFGGERARSGIIALPCGAGKSLIGVAACCYLKKRSLVICNTTTSAIQWKAEFLKWSTVKDGLICLFTSDSKDKPEGCSILITTLGMISQTGQRADKTTRAMSWLKKEEWGIMLLDEVHAIPAGTFRNIMTVVHAHCKLGLTATLVREDDKITDLNFLVGPKLYEGNWLELQELGFIAKVECAEVWCAISAEFFVEYLKKETSTSMKNRLLVVNPEKFRSCQYLIRYHEERKDKIIIFSDDIFALKFYADALKKPFIYGHTSQTERAKILDDFKEDRVNTIFVSKVADTSFNLPEANILIQISSHGGSRRQEAQRLGRIMRRKKDAVDGDNSAYFYTLIAQNTKEKIFAQKRQTFMLNQGYSYKPITELPGLSDDEDLLYGTKKEKKRMLKKVLAASDDETDGDLVASKKGGPKPSTSGTNAGIKRSSNTAKNSISKKSRR